nr:MAG TPA: hypothetical protein [Caudoviricetes sp.]
MDSIASEMLPFRRSPITIFSFFMGYSISITSFFV